MNQENTNVRWHDSPEDQKELPSLEEYEVAQPKANENGRIVVQKHQAEVPKVT